MATSGSYNYNLTAADICQAALENISVYSSGETLSASDQTLAMTRLNMLSKSLSGRIDMAPGLKIWARQRISLFLAKGQQTYTIGPAATDSRATTQYGRTTIRTAAAANATTLNITATTDTTTYPGTTVTMTAADIIGVQEDDGTISWSTISSTGAGPTVVIGTGIASAASVGNYVWWFTNRAQRFVELESAVLRDKNYMDQVLRVYRDVQTYEVSVVDKYSDADPTAVLVEPLRLNTRITLDSQPVDVTNTIQITAMYPMEDYDATTDDIAFPQEYFDFLSWELGLRCCPAFGAVWTPVMEQNRKEALTYAKNLNAEVTDAYFQCGDSG